MDKYEIITPLGKGTYGKVFKAVKRDDGYHVCIKQVSLEGMTTSEQQETLNEVKLKIRTYCVMSFR